MAVLGYSIIGDLENAWSCPKEIDLDPECTKVLKSFNNRFRA